jgi:hypothetical protein
MFINFDESEPVLHIVLNSISRKDGYVKFIPLILEGIVTNTDGSKTSSIINIPF